MGGAGGKLCRSFWGTVKEDDEPEEELGEHDDFLMPKDYRQLVTLTRGSGFGGRLLGRGLKKDAGSRGWAPFIMDVTVTKGDGPSAAVEHVVGLKATDAVLTQEMWEKFSSLPELGNFYLIELVRCQLRVFPPIEKLKGLKVLRLSHNLLGRLAPRVELEKDDKSPKGEKTRSPKAVKMTQTLCDSLEQFLCDHNRLRTIELQVLGGPGIQNLKVLNLSHNELSFLPADLGTQGQKLRFLDLSFNHLTSLPDNLRLCTRLEVLIANNNALEMLPIGFGDFAVLRKLHVSFNQLTALPDDLGSCSRLERIRVSHNQLRRLPDSILKLWKGYEGVPEFVETPPPGRLEELLVDNNPLTQPSTTAFEMGGLDQALRLFSEWLQLEQKDKKRQQDWTLTLEDEEGEDQLQPAKQQPIKEESKELLALETVADAGPVVEPINYYLSDKPQWPRLPDIRTSETTLLLMKKGHFVKQQREAIRRRLPEENVVWPLDEKNRKELATKLDKSLHPFLEADPSAYTGPVYVTQLDLYFCLLVFSTKPLYQSCFDLWDRFENHGKPYLDKRAWFDLCERVPIKMPEEIREQIWDVLSRAIDSQSNEKFLLIEDFVSGWHIHDLETKDPWIQRVCEVLHLEYYKMEPEDLRLRLQAQAATDPEAPIAIPFADQEEVEVDLDEELERRAKLSASLMLPQGEGERFLPSSSRNNRPASVSGQGSVAREDTQALADDFNGLSFKAPRRLVSLTTHQYYQLLDEGSVETDDSEQLSRNSFTSEESFDGWEAERRRLSQRQSLLALPPMASPLQESQVVQHWEPAPVAIPLPAQSRSPIRAPAPEIRSPQAGRLFWTSFFEEVADRKQPELSSELTFARLMEAPVSEILEFLNRQQPEPAVTDCSSMGASALDELTLPRSPPRSEAPRSPSRAPSEAPRSPTRAPSEPRSPTRATSPKHRLSQEAQPRPPKAKKPKGRLDPMQRRRPPKDPRYRTDVYLVKRVLREARRNMPLADFTTMISFLLRGLKRIKFYDVAETTLHSADPSFAFSLGSGEHLNRYAQKLLVQMGFVCIESSWVWPSMHLAGGPDGEAWGTKVVPSDCPGLKIERLQDMLDLLNSVQRALEEGHLK